MVALQATLFLAVSYVGTPHLLTWWLGVIFSLYFLLRPLMVYVLYTTRSKAIMWAPVLSMLWVLIPFLVWTFACYWNLRIPFSELSDGAMRAIYAVPLLYMIAAPVVAFGIKVPKERTAHAGGQS